MWDGTYTYIQLVCVYVYWLTVTQHDPLIYYKTLLEAMVHLAESFSLLNYRLNIIWFVLQAHRCEGCQHGHHLNSLWVNKANINVLITVCVIHTAAYFNQSDNLQDHGYTKQDANNKDDTCVPTRVYSVCNGNTILVLKH